MHPTDQRNHERHVTIHLQISAPEEHCTEQCRIRTSVREASSERALTRPTIKFYERDMPYFEFTNFSKHPVRYNGKDYATSEHLFQALKFEDDADAERIRVQPTPGAAAQAARQLTHRVRKGWLDQELNIRMMDEVLMLKFTQYPALKEKLLLTGNDTLVEDSPYDSFWGIGANGRGQNQLGKALERLRSKLRNL